MSSPKIVELNENNICKICENALAKYVCPRCKIVYCSLKCYQSEKHSPCSEAFYKESVIAEMRISENDPTLKTRMSEILKRIHETNPTIGEYAEYHSDDDTPEYDANESGSLDSDDDEDLSDIADRLANVDLDDAEKVWEKLTEDERQAFVSFLQSDDVANLIPQWEPWWSFRQSSSQMVVDADEDTGENDYFKVHCPPIMDISDFDNICKKPPADCVKYNLVNILAAYAFMTKYFNGDYKDYAKEAASCVSTGSGCLKSNQNFEDYGIAYKSVEQACINCEWMMTDAENFTVMKEDLDKILEGPRKTERKYYILCALSDLHNLFGIALNQKDDTTPNSFVNKLGDQAQKINFDSPEKIRNYMKKIEYFASYTKDHFTL